MTTLPQERAFQPPYELSGSLSDESELFSDEDAKRVLIAEPSEADREELLLKKLGPRGWGRMHQFRYFYTSGWGDGQGKPLSPRSLEGFFRFLEIFEFPPTVLPSVFLTDNGHIELAWEDSSGRTIQVEFTSASVEFFVEASRRDGAVSYANLPKLLPELLSAR